MFLYLVRRDIVVLYKQTVLGPVWVILQPLLMSFLFTMVFNQIAGLRTDGVPSFLFYFGNNVFWSYMSASYTSASSVFTKGKGLMAKVYFPRLIVPLANLGGNFFKLGIQFLFLAALVIYYLLAGIDLRIGAGLLWLPIVVLQLSLIALGAGFLFSCITLKYRDLTMISGIFVQIWMYLSPVAFPISEVPEKYARVMMLNPVTSALELARHSVFGTSFPSSGLLATGLATTLVLFFFGLLSFNVQQRKFIDVI